MPGFGGIPRLRRDLGNAVVRDLLLTGRSINASKAGSVGLVSQVVPRGRGLEVARKVGEQAAKFDRATTAAAKRFAKPIPRAELRREKDLFIELMGSPVVEAASRSSSRATTPTLTSPEPSTAMASNDSILEKLLKLAAKRFERDTSALRADDDFFDRLDINSYQAMELLTEIEDEWSIEIPDYEVRTCAPSAPWPSSSPTASDVTMIRPNATRALVSCCATRSCSTSPRSP